MLLDKIVNNYHKYKEKNLKNRFFTSDELHHILSKHHLFFDCEIIGNSFQNRPIKLYKIGTGSLKAMFWSQMHGDEPTASAALADLFNFFNADDEFNGFRNELITKFTFYFIPMLNPDGAQKFTRRNAQNIDINRDFLAEQSPEASILKNIREKFLPHFGFNLHDQDTLYQVGETAEPACMAFLSPSIDKSNTINHQREQAMKIIVYMHNVLNKYIPGKIARFKDDFEPRAFGDQFQKAGTCIILIESGGLKKDPEKQEIRKHNFTAMLAALESILSDSYKKQTVNEYFNIPENKKSLFHICIRNVLFIGAYKADVGLTYRDIFDEITRKVTQYWQVAHFGDLSSAFAYEDYDAKNATFEGNINLEKAAHFRIISKHFELNFQNGFLLNKNL